MAGTAERLLGRGHLNGKFGSKGLKHFMRDNCTVYVESFYVHETGIADTARFVKFRSDEFRSPARRGCVRSRNLFFHPIV